MMNRRTFVAGASAFSLIGLRREVKSHAQILNGPTDTQDPVILQATSDLQRVHDEVKATGMWTSAQALQGATALRYAVAQCRATNVDARLQTAVRTAIRSQGRDTIVQMGFPDRDVFVAHARTQGLDLTDLKPYRLSYDQVDHHLTTLMAQGITPSLQGVQRVLERAAPKLSQNVLPSGGRIVPAQSCQDAWSLMFDTMSVFAAYACIYIPPLCPFLLADLAFILMMEYALCYIG